MQQTIIIQASILTLVCCAFRAETPQTNFRPCFILYYSLKWELKTIENNEVEATYPTRILPSNSFWSPLDTHLKETSTRSRLSTLQPMGSMQPKMALNEAQHRFINILKT